MVKFLYVLGRCIFRIIPHKPINAASIYSKTHAPTITSIKMQLSLIDIPTPSRRLLLTLIVIHIWSAS